MAAKAAWARGSFPLQQSQGQDFACGRLRSKGYPAKTRLLRPHFWFARDSAHQKLTRALRAKPRTAVPHDLLSQQQTSEHGLLFGDEWFDSFARQVHHLP